MLPKIMDIFISINRLHRSVGQVFAFRKSLDAVVPLNVDRRNVKQHDDALRPFVALRWPNMQRRFVTIERVQGAKMNSNC